MRDFFKMLVTLGIIALVAIGIWQLIRFDYYVWRLKHPTAPTWTYFIK